MLFSLARAGQAPSAFGRASPRGPAPAVLATAVLALLVVLAGAWFPGQTYAVATSIATAGLLFVWLAIFLTYIGYRRGQAATAKFHPAGHLGSAAAVAGALVVATIAASTWVIESFSLTLRIGLPFMALLWIGHALRGRRGLPRVERANTNRLCADQLIG
ncbi:Proline-specific permease ProY [compost metagenome]